MAKEDKNERLAIRLGKRLYNKAINFLDKNPGFKGNLSNLLRTALSEKMLDFESGEENYTRLSRNLDRLIDAGEDPREIKGYVSGYIANRQKNELIEG